MSHCAPDSKPIASAPAAVAGDAVRDLVAAMPIVIFAQALRKAFQRPASPRRMLQASLSH